MPAQWTPRDYAILITIGSTCLCLVILVLGTVIGVLQGVISVQVLGTIKGAGVGGGLLGLGAILCQIIKVSLSGGNE